MTFADLQLGDAVFLDANTFIYHFTPDPLLGPPCSLLGASTRSRGRIIPGRCCELSFTRK